MEWLVIYLFVMIEKVAALLALGWAAFWIGAGLIGLSIMVCGMQVSHYPKTITFSQNMAEPYAKLARKAGKWFMIVGFIFGGLSMLIPDQKNMAIIAGTGITYKAVTSETGQRIGGKAISLLEQKIDAALSDTPDPKAPVKADKAPVVEGKAL